MTRSYGIDQANLELRKSMLNTNEYLLDHPCPIRDVLDRIGDQWSLLVLEALEGRTLRFNELGRTIEDISKQMLYRTLKRLEMDGFVMRCVFAEVPPRVEYQLTELGNSFLQPLHALVRWADVNHAQIRRARKSYRPA